MTPRRAFRSQAAACARLGSPFMARLLGLLCEMLDRDTALGARILDWPGDTGPHGDSVPLRLAGALHALVLDGTAPDLAAAYPPRDRKVDDASLRAVLADSMARHASRLLAWLDQPPQTNEVRRSAALIPAFHLLAGQYKTPLVLSELGASAGLNLFWDRYRLDLGTAAYGPADSPVILAPRWTGTPPAPARIEVAERAGADLRPLDGTKPEDRLRALAYLWPDQPGRIARTRRALDLQGLSGAPVTRADAIDWLRGRLAARWPGHLHVVYHSIAWQYFPPAARAAGRALLAEAGAEASADAPLAHLELESDGRAEGAALHLTCWPGGRRRRLGRVDFHGRWVRWSGVGSGPGARRP